MGGRMSEITDSPTGWVARHIRSYVRSNGKTGHRFHGHDALLLTTRGRRSGKLRRTALYYGRSDDRYLVVASGGGEPTHPAWYLNLRANPDVVVQVGAEIFVARAGPRRPRRSGRCGRSWSVSSRSTSDTR